MSIHRQTTPKTHRIFFALWPEDDIREKIAGQMAPLFRQRGKKVPVHNWHITLAFLGTVQAKTYQCAIHQVEAVRGAPFCLQLDALGHWARPRVAWLGCHEIPEALGQLVNDLNSQLSPCGYQPEFRSYQPHLTLLRKVQHKPEWFEFEPIEWNINDFVLVESQQGQAGSLYKVIRRWPLIT